MKNAWPAFLPNDLVGTGAKPAPVSRSIIDRIRLARDPMAFRLLIDLYSLQDLAEHGGVERHYLFKTFDHKLCGANGSYNVFEFSEPEKHCRVREGALVHHEEPDKPGSPAKAFYERLNILEDAGAVEWVYYVVEDDSDASVRIHPLAVERHGKLAADQLETVLGSHAVAAACGLLGRPDDIQSMDDAMPGKFLVPVERLAKNATVRGVARMRSRAKTNNATIWLSELVDNVFEYASIFMADIERYCPQLQFDLKARLSKFGADPSQLPADFKGGSTRFQGYSKGISMVEIIPYARASGASHGCRTMKSLITMMSLIPSSASVVVGKPVCRGGVSRQPGWRSMALGMMRMICRSDICG